MVEDLYVIKFEREQLKLLYFSPLEITNQQKLCGRLCSTLGDRKGEQNSIPTLGDFTAFEKGREETFFECLLGISSLICIV